MTRRNIIGTQTGVEYGGRGMTEDSPEVELMAQSLEDAFDDSGRLSLTPYLRSERRAVARKLIAAGWIQSALIRDACEAIADWINGAPCPDPAYYRSVVNRLDILAT